MVNKLIPVLCPTCNVEYSAKPSFMSGRASRGKRCPNGHWHTLNSIACYKQKLENAKLKPAKVKKAKPVTLKSLGLGGSICAPGRSGAEYFEGGVMGHNVEFSGDAPLFGAASAGTKGYASGGEE